MNRPALLAIIAVIAVACGGGDDPPPSTTSSTTTTSTSSTVPPTTTTTAPEPIPGPDQALLDSVSVRLEPVARLEEPVVLVQRTDDPALYVAERTGRVRSLRGGAPDPDPILDLSGEVSLDGERGLLGIAFSPDGSRLYASYTDLAGDSRLVEWTMGPGAVDPASRRDVLLVDQPDLLHNGGHVAFGLDGLLWWGLGDGGGRYDPQGNAQRLDTLLGKLVRIDPRPGADGAPYQVPPDNPFVATPGARPEIWALGLRNPWRWSFDRATGQLWIGDVGQFIYEELSLAPALTGPGANYGWPAREGPRRTDEPPAPEPLVPPLLTYNHDDGRCVITAGYVYRGSDLPALRGAHVFGDYCDGRVRAVSERDGRLIAERILGPEVPQLVSFGQGAGGELYVLSLGGDVHRLVPA